MDRMEMAEQSAGWLDSYAGNCGTLLQFEHLR
jgi:hypothetical protein